MKGSHANDWKAHANFLGCWREEFACFRCDDGWRAGGTVLLWVLRSWVRNGFERGFGSVIDGNGKVDFVMAICWNWFIDVFSRME